MTTCPYCHGSTREWEDDEFHPDGGRMVPCHRCACDACGAELDGPFGACPHRCGEVDPDEGTGRELERSVR